MALVLSMSQPGPPLITVTLGGHAKPGSRPGDTTRIGRRHFAAAAARVEKSRLAIPQEKNHSGLYSSSPKKLRSTPHPRFATFAWGASFFACSAPAGVKQTKPVWARL